MARGMRDYDVPLPSRVGPAPVRPPLGPDNFPVEGAPPTVEQLLATLVAQNASRMPHGRSTDVTSGGQTLDWSQMGLCDRILVRNKGPNSVWISFDIVGPAVDAFTSDLSYELQAQESICISACQFYKLGCRCAAGQTGTVHAFAFLAAVGNLDGSIS